LGIGPHSSLIYINDIQNVCHNVDIRLFADNTNVFVHGKSIHNVVSLLIANTALEMLCGWFTANKLTCCSVFGHVSETLPQMSVLKLITVFCHEYIGIKLIKQLSWKNHTDYVYSKLITFASIFTARRSYASAVLGVVILILFKISALYKSLNLLTYLLLSVCPSVHLCFVSNPKNLPATFLYHMKGQSF